jgi:hypothetical protein
MSDRVCGAEVELHREVLGVLRTTPADLPPADPGEVMDPLRCALQAGHGGEHHALARGLPLRYLGEVWARWGSGQQPQALMVFTDCPVRDPDDRDEPCLLFNGHTGAHSWLLSDPEEGELRVWLERVPAQPASSTTLTHPAIQSCQHLKTEKRDGKTYCARCKRQIYL